MFDFPGLLRNVPVLEHAAAGRGLFTIRPERDGIIRRVPMIMQAQGQTMPSLTFEILRDMLPWLSVVGVLRCCGVDQPSGDREWTEIQSAAAILVVQLLPLEISGPTRFSQIRSPVRASSAWTTFMMLTM